MNGVFPTYLAPEPKGAKFVYIVDPYTGRPVAPLGSSGRYTSPNGESLFIRNLRFSVADNTADGSIIPAVPYYIISVVGYIVQSGATAQTFQFKSKGSGAGTPIGHIMQNGAYGGAQRDIVYGGQYFQTLPGEALTGGTSSASGAATTGSVDYVLVPDPSIQWADGSPVLDENGQTINL